MGRESAPTERESVFRPGGPPAELDRLRRHPLDPARLPAAAAGRRRRRRGGGAAIAVELEAEAGRVEWVKGEDEEAAGPHCEPGMGHQ